LNISHLVKPKARLGTGGMVAEFVASGEVEMALHQISEILPVKGVRYAGPLPAELQKFTTYVAAAVSQVRVPLLNQFIAHLTGPQARQRLAPAGYTSPE
jgi:molybdate transport system substrate-binding protein